MRKLRNVLLVVALVVGITYTVLRIVRILP